jgi:AcrR family transcriptional regulator
MPKTYTDKEREHIKNKLKEEALDCLTLYGVKKTTVDELVKRVNIPKGTFYLFYESKELLLFDVINDVHDEIQTLLINEMGNLGDRVNSQQVTDLLYRLYKKVDDTCLLNIMTNGDLELIMRKLPDKIVAEHQNHDDFMMEQLLSYLPHGKDKNIEVYSGALRGIFLTLLHRREIGDKVFEEALRLMIHGVVIQLLDVK